MSSKQKNNFSKEIRKARFFSFVGYIWYIWYSSSWCLHFLELGMIIWVAVEFRREFNFNIWSRQLCLPLLYALPFIADLLRTPSVIQRWSIWQTTARFVVVLCANCSCKVSRPFCETGALLPSVQLHVNFKEAPDWGRSGSAEDRTAEGRTRTFRYPNEVE